jgi:hypothetical protein
MLTLLINETKPLAGLFASTTGGIGSVPDISVADEGQAVSVQTFTRTAGVITDSFVSGDVLHIGIGDGVNAPVCYIALASASPATGTMAINTVGMVALFAATSANQLTLNVGVVRTRGGYTNTIFSAPIVIHRSVIDPDTAVPTPSILGTGVAAALQVAINTALGFVRLDASARLPAVDGSQLTNVPNELPSQTGNSGKYLTTNGTAASWGAVTGGVTSITGTANEITVTGTTTPTLSLPSALTFTGKTVEGGTFTGGAFNGTVGATTPSTIAGTTGTFSGELSTTGTNAQIYTSGAAAYLATYGAAAHIYTDGADAQIYTSGLNGRISTGGANAHISTGSSGAYIQSRSTFRLNSGTFITTLSHAPTADRAIALPDAAGTLALVSGDLGTPSAIVLTNASGTASININGTVGATTPSTVAGTTITGTSSLTLGTNGGTGGSVVLNGSTSGSATLSVAATGVLALPLFTVGSITVGNGIVSADRITAQNPNIATLGIDISPYNGTAQVTAGHPWMRLGGGSSDSLMINAGLTGGYVSICPDLGSGLIVRNGTGGHATYLTTPATGTLRVTTNGSTLGTVEAATGTFTSTSSLLLGTAGSAVGTIGFNNATSGTTTLAPATGALGTGTVTLPLSGTLAISSGAQTFTGVQSMTSPSITTSITTPSTTFALVNATATTLNIGGAATTIAMGAAGAGTMNIPLTTSASSATTGALTIGNGTAATNVGIGGGNINAGGTIAATTRLVAGSATIGGRALQSSDFVVVSNGATAATDRATIRWGGGGYSSGPSAANSDANGDKLVFVNQAGGKSAIGSGNDYDLWFQGRSTGTIARFYDGTTERMNIIGQAGATYNGATVNVTGTLGVSSGVYLNSVLSVTGASTLTGLLTANGGITLGDAQNIAFNTTTGTKIGAATTQKLSFWNATPIVQPTTAVASATVASPGGGVNIKTDDTFDGYTIAQVVKALRNAGLLA